MIHECDIRRRGDAILIGIALEHALLDFETTENLLRDCSDFLETPHMGFADISIGKFGPFQVRLNMHPDATISIFVAGPQFEPNREVCAAVWLSKEEVLGVIKAGLGAAHGT